MTTSTAAESVAHAVTHCTCRPDLDAALAEVIEVEQRTTLTS